MRHNDGMHYRDCSDHWCDGCKTCLTGRCCRRDDPARPLPTPGSISPMYGELGVRNEDGERVECHVCGGWYRALPAHIWRQHDLTADEYKAAFGLSRKGLLSTALHDRLVEVQRRAYAQRAVEHRMPVAPPLTAEQRKYGWRSEETRRVMRAKVAPAFTAGAKRPEVRARAIASAREACAVPDVTWNCPVCGREVSRKPHQRIVTCGSRTCVRTYLSRLRLGTPPSERQHEAARRLGAVGASMWTPERRELARVRGLQMTDGARERMRAYIEKLGPEAAQELRVRAARISAERKRKPHPCTWCGKLLPRATPKTCSPECRREVRRATARRTAEMMKRPPR